ncbi:hypothetical protein QJS10_CPB14g00558 [Acorus calamus]|uniref:Uncharacterized protein n=1 Tax=Acorus calamus TaxID=4465 RepID=A0AAV9D9P2_ACOCL|nr:hypothetical protein QJS10_CPB14g00558 [Acorus calamus]
MEDDELESPDIEYEARDDDDDDDDVIIDNDGEDDDLFHLRLRVTTLSDENRRMRRKVSSQVQQIRKLGLRLEELQREIERSDQGRRALALIELELETEIYRLNDDLVSSRSQSAMELRRLREAVDRLRLERDCLVRRTAVMEARVRHLEARLGRKGGCGGENVVEEEEGKGFLGFPWRITASLVGAVVVVVFAVVFLQSSKEKQR